MDIDKKVDSYADQIVAALDKNPDQELIFDISKFKKFKDKIIYIVVDQPPPDLFKIDLSGSSPILAPPTS